jgi:3-hydroxyisobutyrate dehydrogenase
MGQEMTRVGFAGLGLMGKPMAKNILKRGFPLWVYNRTISKTNELKKLGANVSFSPKELASSVDLVITMVTGPRDVDEVLFGHDGVVKAKKRLVVIDMSTIGPQAAKKVSSRLLKFGIEFLDAPVTGSTPKAESGELTIFVGGNQSTLNKAMPVLEAMGTNIHHIGPVGMGQAIKLVNNLLVAQTLTAMAEGFLLGQKMGLSGKKIQQFLENVPAVSPFMKMRMPNLVNNNHKTLFSVTNLDKDLKLAQMELKSKKLPILTLVSKIFSQGAKTENLKDLDISAIVKLLNPK